MENLVFLLKLNTHLILEIQLGKSVFSALSIFIPSHSYQAASVEFAKWMYWFENLQGERAEPLWRDGLIQNYFEVIKEGLQGLPILEKLEDFQEELIERLELELQKELNKLPYYLMFPLLFFMFPAFLALILGPILMEVLKLNL